MNRRLSIVCLINTSRAYNNAEVSPFCSIPTELNDCNKSREITKKRRKKTNNRLVVNSIVITIFAAISMDKDNFNLEQGEITVMKRGLYRIDHEKNCSGLTAALFYRVLNSIYANFWFGSGGAQTQAEKCRLWCRPKILFLFLSIVFCLNIR